MKISLLIIFKKKERFEKGVFKSRIDLKAIHNMLQNTNNTFEIKSKQN